MRGAARAMGELSSATAFVNEARETRIPGHGDLPAMPRTNRWIAQILSLGEVCSASAGTTPNAFCRANVSSPELVPALVEMGLVLDSPQWVIPPPVHERTGRLEFMAGRTDEVE